MPRRGHREEQLLQALRLTESGAKVFGICRKMGISGRRASRLLPLPQSSLRYQSHRDRQEALRMRLRELAASRVRFGYPPRRTTDGAAEAGRLAGERETDLPVV